MLDPYSPQRLVLVASAVSGIAMIVTLLAVWGVEARLAARETKPAPATMPLEQHCGRCGARSWPAISRFSFSCSMLAYSAQELILEPYAGLVSALRSEIYAARRFSARRRSVGMVA